METGSIKINIEAGKSPSIEARLVNNNLWLTKNEIARFFSVFVQKIDVELRSIFNAGLLLQDCTYSNRYIDKGIEKQTMYYNLEVLIFLAYRINTFETKIFRQFVNSALRKELQKIKTPEMYIAWEYLQNGYCLN